jgi:CARDB
MQRALVLLAAFFALAPAAHAASRPQAALVTCDKAAHEAVFEGRMDARAGTARMQMRFLLQDHGPGERYTRVSIPRFSAWHSSAGGRSRYVYTKTLDGLVGPASYRVVVHFRWLAADGTVLHRASVVSAACRQPDPRADLSVSALEVRPAARPERRRYAITVVNSGRSAAPASRVALDLGDGGAPLSGAVGALAPGAEATVVVGGRACEPGTLLTAAADATDVVDEHDEDDDTLALSCPAVAA